MQGKNLLGSFFFALSIVFLIYFTLFNSTYPPPDKADLLNCPAYSPWCTTTNHLRRGPKNPTRHLHSSSTPHHPLDPLTIKEINKVQAILKSQQLFKNKVYAIHSLVLEEPEKSIVLAWRKGDELPPRKASVIARANDVSHILTVDIGKGEVVEHDVGRVSGYPTMTIEDMTSSTWAPLANAEFNRTILERGVDLADLACLPISTGWYGKKEDKRRLVKVQCYSMKDTANFYMRPIEGLTVVVDIDTKEVIEISDKGKIPTLLFSLPNVAKMFNLGAFLALLMLILVWISNLFVPPPPNICGTTNGPPITGPRITLRDGRHLSYLELGVPKEEAIYKIVFIHGHSTSKKDSYLATSAVVQQEKIYIVSFDRPGYGESDSDPDRTIKSSTLDVEELADQLELGEKFYVIGYSMGGMLAWGCIKYIPQRLAGITFISPGISFWWPGLPQDLVEEKYYEQKEWTQWNFRIAHYFPYFMYWWNTQDTHALLTQTSHYSTKFHKQKFDIVHDSNSDDEDLEYPKQQGFYESYLMDIIVGFGDSWEFEPMELENPFPNGEGIINLWQGDKDMAISVELQRYVVSKLPWINYHEVPNGSHTFAYEDNMKDEILMALVNGGATLTSSNNKTNVPISIE